MTEASRQSAITLVVTNSERLEGRSTSSHVFPAPGGSLGSAPTDDWLLQDHSGRILPGHAEICLREGQFCLVDRSGRTFVNDASLPLGQSKYVALRDGDELVVGEYRMRVHMGDRQAEQGGVQSLATLVNDDQALPESEEAGSFTTVETQQRDDPLRALGETTATQRQHDPLDALSARDSGQIDAPIEASDDLMTTVDEADPVNWTPALPSHGHHKEPKMDEKLLNDLERSVGEQLEDRWQEPGQTGMEHLSASPLLRALGGQLDFADSTEQQAFLEESGKTLNATIQGLLKLHQHHDDRRYPLRDRHLQPIEDNPLRLGEDYERTLQTLFSAQRSPVHLSAPAAVAECLQHQQQHMVAIEEAINEALTSILAAFSPDALLKRFMAYRGAGSAPADSEGDWAWNMYRHYFQELNSGRQQGFEKLFWEVFEQAYDASLRRQQREAS